MLIPLTNYNTGKHLLLETDAIECIEELAANHRVDSHGNAFEHPERTRITTMDCRVVVMESLVEIESEMERRAPPEEPYTPRFTPKRPRHQPK